MKASKSGITGFEAFRRYQNGEMSFRERHLLEKEMLENPLVADAYDGFLALQGDQIDFVNIKRELSEKLENRVSANRKRTIPLWAYGAAASLIITVGTFWLVFISNPEKENIRETSKSLVEKPLITPRQETQPASENAPEAAVSDLKPAPKSQPKPMQVQDLEQAIATSESKPEQEFSVAGNADQEPVPAPAQPSEQALSFSTRDQLRSPAASSLREEPKYKKSNRVVPEAASARQQAPTTTTFASPYMVKAGPLMGWEAYHVYLDQQTSAARRKGEVTITFQVNADGTLTDFTAQGKKQLQSDAIRIISGGPMWVPAKQNDSAVGTTATLRLQFKK